MKEEVPTVENSKIKYNIGLDIGTSSIGWAVTDNNHKLLHIKGNNAIGTRLFKEGESASERRGFRTTRRRLNRRKWRLRFLNQIFDEEISKVDPNFFARLKESNLSPKDANKQYRGSLLFDSDKDFYNDNPTIYHLRNKLMTEDKKFDIRAIYLAIHHIVKYRGHFLYDSNVESFKSSEINLDENFEKLNQIFQMQNRQIQLISNDLEDIEAKLSDNLETRNDRQKSVSKLIYIKDNDKDIDNQNKKIATEIIKAVLGLKAKFDIVIGANPENSKPYTLTLNDEDFDNKINELDDLTDEQNEIIEIIREIFSALTLTDILRDSEGQTSSSLSEAMVKKYALHGTHLKWLKDLISSTDPKKANNLKMAYSAFIDGINGKKATADDFYKEIQKNLDDSNEAKKIQEAIDLGTFMPKQRTKENGAVPHQLHQIELDRIIEKQAKYYPFLAELNPNKKRQHVAKYKLDELVAFRVPYYVGPMIDPTENQKNNNSKFAWMKRKEAGEITPWNFDEKVDRVQTATDFINRMTTTDTYLIGEPVLPKNSLIYQKFTVLNEINKLKVNNQPITVKQKQFIFENLFKKSKTVSLKKIAEMLYSQGDYEFIPKVTGTSDNVKVNNNLATYNDLFKIFGSDLEDPNKLEDFEKIIEWSTIFEDQHIFKLKLQEISWLTEKQIDVVSIIRYQGWGRLSDKLINGLTDDTQNRIIDLLWETNHNFMEIIARDDFKELLAEYNGESIQQEDINSLINDLYTSPQNKKAIRQVLLVVKDIVDAVGYEPENIFMEFAREDSTDHRLTASRKNQIENFYKNVSDELLQQEVVNKNIKNILKDGKYGESDFKDRLFLYFLQGGIDLYDGQKINVDDLLSYDIDHILPQSFILDNSIDNRILTSRKNNREVKQDRLPGEIFGPKMTSKWFQLKNHGFISNRKFANLMLKSSELDKYNHKDRFINRQLVETRQVIKLTAEIMNEKYKDTTNIISVKAGLTHYFREKFAFYKNRNVNDYHHAFDGYLTAFIGNYLLQTYPKLSPLFTYGDFSKVEFKNISTFNFMNKFEKDHQVNKYDEVISDTNDNLTETKNGEIIAKNDEFLGYMRKVYQFKKILVTKEVYQNNGALYKQTLYPSPVNDQKTRKLINAKNNRPAEIYGGYTSKTNIFMSLVKFDQKNKSIYKLVNIPSLEFNLLENRGFNLESAVSKILNDQFDISFEIIISKVLINQKFKDNSIIFTMGSANEKHNAQQLVLDSSIMRFISLDKNKLNNDDLNLILEKIIIFSKDYLKLFDIKNIQNVFNNFKEIKDIDTKYKIINDLLAGLHANATRSDLKQIGLSSTFGRFSAANGHRLSKDTIIIYESVTGLFVRKVKISDL